ncbi:MAG: type II toxin-antitoxin system Phd/YefM family antitoxin [Chloroflexi bacterium]|nr:type II toxin-antitoxin system Phd/YefM family antitoxin [Chloroflexota bacterium]
MVVTLNSSQVQQNFGQAMDRALLADDVVIERYGIPRVTMMGYPRYRRLVEAEQELLRVRLQQAAAAASARAAHLSDAEVDELIERARTEQAAFDITQTRTWALRGTLEVAEPEPEYIVGRDEQGRPITNYAEHVDDVLY